MGKTLIIVESPSKAKTIKKYLGSNYIVKSSVGHIIDLPKSTLGIDLENDFEPKYISVRGKGPIIKEIRDAYKKSTKLLLATDPDREGEAIAWHIKNALKVEDDVLCRVAFNEITKDSVKEAIKSPRLIDYDLVDAQQARRLLDRIVGYKLSPLLWKKIKKGLSAGRVQSVALKIIMDREQEIDDFIEEEYYTIDSLLKLGNKDTFNCELSKINGKKAEIQTKEDCDKIIEEIKKEKGIIGKVVTKNKSVNPDPPFITSTMQQKCANKLNFSSKKTMQIAQQLYEGIDIGKENGGTVGLITYMRTDSIRVSQGAKEDAKKYILDNLGQEYYPEEMRYYKGSKKAQDAHEAIRPSLVLKSPDMLKPYLSKDQFKLYKLIWERFIASEMAPSLYENLNVETNFGPYMFKSKGSILKFPGYLKLTKEVKDDNIHPAVKEKESVTLEEVIGNQHFTSGPPRYTEASLIKKLEVLGIGRPSTYASIVDTITRRGYVTKENKQFYKTELGSLVNELLMNYFNNIVNVEYTSNMEEKLDEVAEGKIQYKEILREFYGPFSKYLDIAEKEIEKIELTKEPEEISDVICDKCGRNMVVKNGRFGKFLACPGFPECRNTQTLIEETGVDCPNCKEGKILVKRSKKGRVFFGCSAYPECETSYWYRPTGEKCPNCGKMLLDRGKFIACEDTKECKFRKDKVETPENIEEKNSNDNE